eukprot:365526-Chlamydomonas_euryale.AAC.1
MADLVRGHVGELQHKARLVEQPAGAVLPTVLQLGARRRRRRRAAVWAGGLDPSGGCSWSPAALQLQGAFERACSLHERAARMHTQGAGRRSARAEPARLAVRPPCLGDVATGRLSAGRAAGRAAS